MTSIVPRTSLVQQTSEYLRAGFLSGRWKGYLPGVKRLAEELCVSRDTLRAAVAQLENDGALCSRGSGRRRQIKSSPPCDRASGRKLRVALLVNEPIMQDNTHSLQLILTIKHRIELAGHICFFSDRSISQLHNQPARVARMVRSTEADAWIVYSAPREVLEWFAEQKLTVMALGGAHGGLEIATNSAVLAAAMTEAMRHLIGLGHRRIVFLAPPRFHRPGGRSVASAFLESFKTIGVRPSDFNFPEWDGSRPEFENLLTSLFSVTPPTALILMEATYCVGAVAFLAKRNIQVPRDLSLISVLLEPVFSWHDPPLAHFEWPLSGLIRRTVAWVENVSKGKTAPVCHQVHAKFCPGKSIAVARALR